MAISTGKLKALLADNAAAILQRMNWAAFWVEGTYQDNDVVQDTGWLMVANKETTDRAAPQPNGLAEYLLADDQPFTTESTLTIVSSGHQYTFTKAGVISAARVWVPVLGADIDYRILVINITDSGNIVARSTLNPALLANEWTTVGLGNLFVSAGDVYLLYIETNNSSTETVVNGDWLYGGVSNAGAPIAESWNRRNQNDIVRVDYDDEASADRSADLLTIKAGSTLRFDDNGAGTGYFEYHVTDNPTDEGTYIQYQVTLNSSAGTISVGASTKLTGTIPIPQSTDYMEDAGYWPGNQPDYAAVEGHLRFNGSGQVAEDDAFGVDFRFQEYAVSPDWDFMSLSLISVPEPSDEVAFQVATVSANYQVLMSDDAVSTTNEITVTLPNIADAIKPVLISCDTGTATVEGDATIQGSTSVTAGTSSQWFPANGQWWRG